MVQGEVIITGLLFFLIKICGFLLCPEMFNDNDCIDLANTA